MRSSVPILTVILILAAPPALAEEPPGAVASVSVRSTLTQLVEGGEGQVFLVITNASRNPVRVVDVLPFDHPFVSINRTSQAFPIEIPPRQSQAIPYLLKARDAVETGEQLLLWQVDLGWDEGGVPQRGRLLAEARFKTKVLGESEVLDALQLPSLLLLPGVLFLLVLPKLEAARRRFFRLEGEPDPEPRETLIQTVADALRPERVLMAVLFSLAMTFSYRLLFQRDFLVRYGLLDIFSVCVLSVLAAALACAGEYGFKRWRLWWRDRRTPSEKDGPVEALLKLERRGGRSLVLPQLGADFVLAEDQEGLWIGSPIRVDERALSTSGLWDRLEALLEAGRPAALARFFRAHEELQPRWKQNGPRQVTRSAAVDAVRRPARRLVEI